MPDIHAGKGCVIGFTANLGDKVIPNIVGVDIGCGMLTAEHFMKLEFNSPDSIRKSPNELIYTYSNGDVVRWLRPNHTSREYKNYKAYVEKSIDNEVVDAVIAPSVIFREIEYFE